MITFDLPCDPTKTITTAPGGVICTAIGPKDLRPVRDPRPTVPLTLPPGVSPVIPVTGSGAIEVMLVLAVVVMVLGIALLRIVRRK